MKCVIVVLALLCSAQALKMDREPMSARARKHTEEFDALDRKAGRPERSKMDRDAWRKASEFTGDSSDITDTIADKLFTYASSYGLTNKIGSCATTHTYSKDIMLCVADLLSDSIASGGMGLTDIICAEVIADNTDADSVIHEALAGPILEADKGWKDVVDVMKDESDRKRIEFNYHAKQLTNMDAYLAAHSVASWVQTKLDAYTVYCDEIAAGACTELITSNALGKTDEDNTEATLKTLVKNNVAGDTSMPGGRTYGDKAKIDWNNYANGKIAPHLEHVMVEHFRTYKTKHENRQRWRKGEFRKVRRH